MIRLYSYFRSSTAYRVRIALNLKDLDYITVPVNLLQHEQRSEEYLKINPLGGVPTLDHHGFIFSQSMAIIEYLDETYPQPPQLLPKTSEDRAKARQIALGIAEDIHPLINMKVQKYLSDNFAADESAKKAWYMNWALSGMRGVENLLARSGISGNYALGDKLSLADICIIPHMYSMRRMGAPLDEFPLCRRIEAHCIRIEAFKNAAPEMQPDAPDGLEQIHGPDAPLLKAA